MQHLWVQFERRPPEDLGQVGVVTADAEDVWALEQQHFNYGAQAAQDGGL